MDAQRTIDNLKQAIAAIENADSAAAAQAIDRAVKWMQPKCRGCYCTDICTRCEQWPSLPCSNLCDQCV